MKLTFKRNADFKPITLIASSLKDKKWDTFSGLLLSLESRKRFNCLHERTENNYPKCKRKLRCNNVST